MAEYIDREAFIADKKWLYCTDCEKRKGKKRGKMVTLYEIGEAPCKSCGIHDMLEEVECYPAADAIEGLRRKYTEERNAAVELTGELATVAAKLPRWIPVTERLPDDDTHVLGWDGKRVRFVYVVTDLVFDAFAEKEGITHWMPLPEPPKEE